MVSVDQISNVGKRPVIFKSIEAGRGLAALLVVLYHINGSFLSDKYWHTRVAGGVLGIGYIGVEFFFVLSGFIILQVHAADVGCPPRFGHYVMKRFVRIYPIYWIFLALMIASTIVTGLGQPLNWSLILQSIILIGPDEAKVPLTVAWTLFHEIAFYIAFGICIVSFRVGGVVVSLWVLLIVSRIFGISAPWLPAYISAPVNLLFLFGAVACWISSRALIPAPATVAGGAAVAFIGIALEIEYLGYFTETTNTLLLGISAAVGLAAVVTLERQRSVAVPRVLLSAGAASYSVYLLHAPVIAMLSKLAVRSGASTAWPIAISFTILFTLPLALGFFFHRIIERPVLTWMSNRLSNAFPFLNSTARRFS